MNKVVHFEITVDDEKRAQDFYRDVFDWGIQAVPGMGYTMVQTGPTDDQGSSKESGFINGGMMKRFETITHPVITIDVDDIDIAAKKITDHGGEIIREKVAVGDMGWSAYFKDSEGNIMGLWQKNK